MAKPVSRRTVLGLILNFPILLAACSAVSSSGIPTEEPGSADLAGVTATPEPTITATPLPTPVPTPTPVLPALELRPPQIPQGGTATVVLNSGAASASATFQGHQYPMLASGDRHWAVVGTGAFTTPGPYTVNVTYTPSGQAPVSMPLTLPITDAHFVVEDLTLDAQTAALLAPDIVNAELNKRAAIYSAYTLERYWKGPFLRPSTAAIGDTYGLARSYNGSPPTDYHRGTDFTGNTGDRITAAAAGKVVFVGALMVRGNSVIIDHGAGVFTAYHHLSHFDIAQGADVAAGQLLGLIGATGLVTGPHLHWEVIVRGQEVDGLLWLNGTTYGV